MTLALFLVTSWAGYVGFGLPFGILFVMRLARRLDPAAGTGTLGFRLAILPGAVALWPWLLYLLLRGGRNERETAHDLSAHALSTHALSTHEAAGRARAGQP